MISCRRFLVYYLGFDSFRFISRKKNDHGGLLLHNYQSGCRVQRVRDGGGGEGEGLPGNTCESA